MRDDAFGQAISVLCAAIPTIFKHEPRLVQAIGDYGAFAIVISAVGIADKGDGQFTFAAIQAIVVPRGWASSRRTRALIDWLEWTGAALRHPPRKDSRERPWSLSGWLPVAIARLARAYLVAVAPWRGDADKPRTSENDPMVLDALVTSLSRLVRAASPAFIAGAQMRLFADHAAGFPILLEIVGACRSTDPPVNRVLFSRKAVSRTYNVSRAHVTAILAKAERSNMLVRDGNEIIVTESMSVQILHDLACQLAIVVLIVREV